MYLTNLAAVLRSAGLRVVEVPGWQSRGRGPMIAARSITCHHTAGPKSHSPGATPSLSVVTKGRSDLPGPLCHLYLSRDGVWYVVAAGRANHAGATREAWQGNSYAIGIEAEAAGVPGVAADWPEVQMLAYAQGCKALAEAYGIPVSRILGHKEVCAPQGRKPDPNFSMDAFRRRVDSTPTARELAAAKAAETAAARSRAEAAARAEAEALLRAQLRAQTTRRHSMFLITVDKRVWLIEGRTRAYVSTQEAAGALVAALGPAVVWPVDLLESFLRVADVPGAPVAPAPEDDEATAPIAGA